MPKFKYSLPILNASVITGYWFLLVHAFMKWDLLTKGDRYGLVALLLVGMLMT
jgi:hypothetical protein